MIKKLDILIIRAFVGPFIVTFFVSLFVLVMQFFWVYMDDLLGKGFGVWTIVQLLFYMSTTLVPMALPLGILLASIMTFGALGEAYELVAIKSAGISLLRFMRPLVVLISVIGVGAFFFNNNVIPVANLKAFSLLYDLRKARMSLNIRPGQFNHDIPDYSIKIGERDKDERTIRDVVIYDGSPYSGNDRVVLAKSGEMYATPDGHYLVFRLRDGWRYQEGSDNTLPAYGAHATQMRMHFVRYDKIVDLKALQLTRTNQDLFKGSYQMMNVGQLVEDIKGIRRSRAHDLQVSETNFIPYLPVYSKDEAGKRFRRKMDSLQAGTGAAAGTGSFAARIAPEKRGQAVQAAIANVRNAMQLEGYTATNVKLQDQNLAKRDIAFHSKFTLSAACVLLFLIGAPLGAIIRKGGLGMPIVVAIGFFVLYFIVSKLGEQLTESGALPGYIGMWMSTVMLLPISFFIIRAARNDSPLFTKELYLRWWSAILRLFNKAKEAKPQTPSPKLQTA